MQQVLINEYYNLLELNPESSTVDDLKRAFRQKAKLVHPDINPSPDAEEQFIKIHTAYMLVLEHLLGKNIREYAAEWEAIKKQQAAERAQQYARMKYEKFVREFESYHRAPYSWIFKILYYGLYYLYIFCGLIMGLVPLWAWRAGGLFYFLICLPLYILAYFTFRMAKDWKQEIDPLFN